MHSLGTQIVLVTLYALGMTLFVVFVICGTFLLLTY